VSRKTPLEIRLYLRAQLLQLPARSAERADPLGTLENIEIVLAHPDYRAARLH
jgi:hypothetical protein